MNEIEVKEGVLFIDGVKVELKKGESTQEFLSGKLGDEGVFIYGGTFYRGRGVMNAQFIGVVSYEEFVELRNNAK